MHASIAPHRLLPASRMFSALLLSTSRQEARRVLNITLREISKVVGPKPKVLHPSAPFSSDHYI